MTEITRPDPHYISRDLVLWKADSFLKGDASPAEKKGVQEMVSWVVGAVTPELRDDTKATKVVTRYGLYCSHCGTTCAVGDRFCRHCGGRFV